MTLHGGALLVEGQLLLKEESYPVELHIAMPSLPMCW
jgi:hypothetical protein